MAILKVEPLTTARALRGPSTTAGRRRWRTSRSAASSGCRSARGACSASWSSVAEASELPPERLAEPIEALESGAPAELVRLGLWVAREYCSTPSRGLQLVLPPGTGAGGRSVRSKLELRAEILPAGEAALSGGERLGVKQRAVLEALRGGRDVGAGAGRRGRLGPPDPAPARGARPDRHPQLATAPRARAASGLAAPADRPQLLPEQRAAVASIVAALDGEAGAPRELLLHGVTGSGKTEVYLAAVEAALERGRGAIVLVPEIGLAPQAVARFRARLGDRFAVLHSALSAGERYDEWRRLRSGEASVCVGPRSAVFAPVRDLGLIVVDEEHDPSYKQEGDPCYDARAVARRRAEECGAVLVAGTATPRPESWLRAAAPASCRTASTACRLPPVELVDMRGADPRSGPLHADTWEALEDGAPRRRQGDRDDQPPRLRPLADLPLLRAPLELPQLRRLADRPPPQRPPRLPPLRPRRGAAARLPRVRARRRSRAPAPAPSGSRRCSRERLAPMPVFRLDSDTAAERGAHARILARFGEAPSGVLVGTQMVAKGHDFPEVTLSAILDADATLRFPDFRAEERTFAMVAQLAGRSGRGEAGGEVIVQTLAPGAAEHRARRPPRLRRLPRRRAGAPARCCATRPSRTWCGSTSPPSWRRGSRPPRRGLAGELRGALPAGSELLGPAPMFRVRNRHRRRILIKADEREGAVAAVRAAVERRASDRSLRGVAIGVDVDPQ